MTNIKEFSMDAPLMTTITAELYNDLMDVFNAVKRLSKMTFSSRRKFLYLLDEKGIYISEKIDKGSFYSNDIFLFFCCGCDTEYATFIFEKVFSLDKSSYFHPENIGYDVHLKGYDGLAAYFYNHNIARTFPNNDSYFAAKKLDTFGNCTNWINFILSVTNVETHYRILNFLLKK